MHHHRFHPVQPAGAFPGGQTGDVDRAYAPLLIGAREDLDHAATGLGTALQGPVQTSGNRCVRTEPQRWWPAGSPDRLRRRERSCMCAHRDSIAHAWCRFSHRKFRTERAHDDTSRSSLPAAHRGMSVATVAAEPMGRGRSVHPAHAPRPTGRPPAKRAEGDIMKSATEKVLGAQGRRQFLQKVAVGAGAAVAGVSLSRTAGAGAASALPTGSAMGSEAPLTPAEDLMQEHGALERVLLVYEEAARMLEQGESFEPAVITATATLVRRHAENHHQRMEERYIFPQLETTGVHARLTATLRQQHERSRELTDEILQRAQRTLRAGADRMQLARALRQFAKLYRPHAAWEETVIFPAFRGLVGRAAYLELGAEFERQNRAMLGAQGYSELITAIARAEAAVGLADPAVAAVR
jgi:hemerythrin-like domain-containing protein